MTVADAVEADSEGFVPDEVVIGIIKDKIAKEDCANRFILDGFPRTIPQAEALKEIVDLDNVLHLQAKDETIIKRLSGRRMSKSTGNIFIICPECSPNPPADWDMDDMYQRNDDKKEAIEHR